MVLFIALWIVLASVVFAVLIWPFMVFIRNWRWRHCILLIVAGFIGPGGVGGHGFLPLPSAIGVVYSFQHQQWPTIVEHLLFWAATFLCLIGVDTLLLRRAVAWRHIGEKILHYLFHSALVWPLLQLLVFNGLIVLSFSFATDSIWNTIYQIIVMALLPISSFVLGFYRSELNSSYRRGLLILLVIWAIGFAALFILEQSISWSEGLLCELAFIAAYALFAQAFRFGAWFQRQKA